MKLHDTIKGRDDPNVKDFILRFPRDTYEQLRRLAFEHRTSINTLINICIERHKEKLPKPVDKM